MHFTAFFRAQIYGFSDLTGVTLMAVSRVTLCHICDNHICLSFMIIPVNKKAYRVNYSPIVSMTKQSKSHVMFLIGVSANQEAVFWTDLLRTNFYTIVSFSQGYGKNGKT